MSSSREIRSVAIIGSGPAGTTLGCLLREAGIAVTIYNDGKRPRLLVGESLIPAVLPILRRLGIEERVAAVGSRKPGASIALYPDGLQWNLDFSTVANVPVEYAYNVPRHEFDALLLERARELGCSIVEQRGAILSDAPEEPLRLAEVPARSVGSALRPSAAQPDLLIDATGRTRYFSRSLGLEATRGARDDVALFAHLSEAALPHPGYIHISVMKEGWSWRIPLPGRVSVGVVIPQHALSRYGANAEAQYETILAQDPVLAPAVRGGQRLTGVAKYSNYQWISNSLFGPKWALVGDAAGFLDPTFSSGVFLSLYGAKVLAKSLIDHGLAGLPGYEAELRAEYAQWQQLITSFYDGGFFALTRAGHALTAQEFASLPQARLAEEVTARLVSGYGYLDRSTVIQYQAMVGFCRLLDEKRKRPTSPTESISRQNPLSLIPPDGSETRRSE